MRIHYASKEEQAKPRGVAETACRRYLWGVCATSGWEGVTCLSCLKRRPSTLASEATNGGDPASTANATPGHLFSAENDPKNGEAA